MNGKFDKASVPGKDLKLSLDINLQQLGERLLEGKIGSIVAIEPSTGEVLCLVSSPTYDPHLMIGRDRGKNHLALARDPWKPLLNRAIMGAYPRALLLRLLKRLLSCRKESLLRVPLSLVLMDSFSVVCVSDVTHTVLRYR